MRQGWSARADPAESGPANIIRVRGGASHIGTDTPEIRDDGEGPRRATHLREYGLDAATVTNADFARFAEATGHRSDAEKFGWSSVFRCGPSDIINGLAQGSSLPWWHSVEGASWSAPEGPGSTLDERMDHPVVHVSWNDANAFAAWVGGRLPTEAEWEHAARGGAEERRFPWGFDEPSDMNIFCNIWQGKFPSQNLQADGYAGTAPAYSFAPNPLGFYNMSGNVWEWTADAFRIQSLAKSAMTRNAQARNDCEKVLKGGSFLCHVSYCYRYRIAARLGLSPDSSTSNVGFRVAYD